VMSSLIGKIRQIEAMPAISRSYFEFVHTVSLLVGLGAGPFGSASAGQRVRVSGPVERHRVDG
jgi:hypothetical protein